MNGGKAPAHLIIQFMGTPPRSDFPARSNKALDLGRSFTKRCCSRCIRDFSRCRSIDFMVWIILTTEDTESTEENRVTSSALSVSSVVKTLQNVARQILVLHDIRQHLA